MSKMPSYRENKPFYITLIIFIALGVILMLSSLVVFVIEENSYDGDSYGSSSTYGDYYPETITAGGSYYGYQGANTYYFECEESGYYTVALSNSSDVHSVEVYDEYGSSQSSYGNYEYYFYSGNTYTIVIDGEYSFNFTLEN